MGFGSVYSMVLSTWNSEYAFDMFLLCETSNALIGAFSIPKSIFIRQNRLNRLKQY